MAARTSAPMILDACHKYARELAARMLTPALVAGIQPVAKQLDDIVSMAHLPEENDGEAEPRQLVVAAAYKFAGVRRKAVARMSKGAKNLGFRDCQRPPGGRNHRQRTRNSRVAEAPEALRARTLAQGQRSCYDSIATWQSRRGRAALVRGARNRAEGIQDQAVVANVMTKSRKKKSFVVCLSNEGYGASLEPWKIYVAIRDAAAERDGFLRVIDESGEDYLFARERFAPLKLPRGVQQALAASR